MAAKSIKDQLNDLNSANIVVSKFEKNGDRIKRLLKDLRKNGAHDSGVTVYPHQINAVLNTRKLLLKDNFKRRRMQNGSACYSPPEPVLVVAPPGSGKSGMIALISFPLESKKVLAITHSKVVSEQLAQAFGHYPKHKSFYEVSGLCGEDSSLFEWTESVKIISKSEDIEEKLPNVVIVNAQKFGGRSATTLSMKYMGKDVVKNVQAFFNQFDTLIVDEAHHYPAKTWKNIIDAFSQNVDGLEKKIIFFTATPWRRGKDGNYVPILEGQDERIAYEVTQRELRGIIRETIFREGKNSKNIAADLATLLKQQAKTERRFRHQAMVIVRTKNDAHAVANILNESEKLKMFRRGGIVAEAIVDKEGGELGKKFTAGKFRIAVVCEQLKEGYDNPRVSICVIYRRIRSRTTFEQFIGRCMRVNGKLPKEDPDKSVGIIWSYPKFEQEEMWNMQKYITEEDPLEEDELDEEECEQVEVDEDEDEEEDELVDEDDVESDVSSEEEDDEQESEDEEED